MMTPEHIALVRGAALRLMGDKCTVCGESDLIELEIHHLIDCNLGPGRGQDRRAWEGLRIAMNGEGAIRCHACHVAYHRGEHDQDYKA